MAKDQYGATGLIGYLSGANQKRKMGEQFDTTRGEIEDLFSTDLSGGEMSPAIQELQKSTAELTKGIQSQGERAKSVNAPKAAQFLARTGSVSSPQVAAVLGGMLKDTDNATQQQILSLNQAQASKMVDIVNALVHAKGATLSALERDQLNRQLAVEPPINAILSVALSAGIGALGGGGATGAVKAALGTMGSMSGKDKQGVK